ncbi:Hypothetical predicted protein, partial [Mytilus galloprovincialis]
MNYVFYFTLACISCQYVAGHGYMFEPPNRSSLWRLPEFKPIVEPNYNDNALFCGGKWNLASNGGKCGVCGDPYQGPYPNEAGGVYAKGIIARTYKSGQDIPVKIQITANHLGWFEFRLCVNNNISKKITHDCLDKHLLKTSDTGLTRTRFSANSGIKELTLQLPKDLVCSQCVLQWKWRTAISPGSLEEEYYGCSDIAIENFVAAGKKYQNYMNRFHYANGGTLTPASLRPCLNLIGGSGPPVFRALKFLEDTVCQPHTTNIPARSSMSLPVEKVLKNITITRKRYPGIAASPSTQTSFSHGVCKKVDQRNKMGRCGSWFCGFCNSSSACIYTLTDSLSYRTEIHISSMINRFNIIGETTRDPSPPDNTPNLGRGTMDNKYLFLCIFSFHQYGVHVLVWFLVSWFCGFSVKKRLFQNLASNGGKCGVCGDPYQGPYPNEAGGIYAKGIIARTYRSGQDIPVKIQITANHLGWHEFRLCVNNNISKKITHRCLDNHLLKTSDTGFNRTTFSASTGIKELTLKLPKDLICSQCVLQWKWRTESVPQPNGHGSLTNSPGSFEEEYYGCSDIAIEKSHTSFSCIYYLRGGDPTKMVDNSYQSENVSAAQDDPSTHSVRPEAGHVKRDFPHLSFVEKNNTVSKETRAECNKFKDLSQPASAFNVTKRTILKTYFLKHRLIFSTEYSLTTMHEPDNLYGLIYNKEMTKYTRRKQSSFSFYRHVLQVVNQGYEDVNLVKVLTSWHDNNIKVQSPINKGSSGQAIASMSGCSGRSNS